MIRNFFSSYLSTHRISISRVIKSCSCIKMIWINAYSISALMKNPQIGWFFSMMNFPRDLVRLYWRNSSTSGNMSVPMSVLGSGPFPTSICFFNKFPETLFYGFFPKRVVAWTTSFIAPKMMSEIYSAVKAIFSHEYNYIKFTGVRASTPLATAPV